MGQRRMYSVARALVGGSARRGMVAGSLVAGFAAWLGEALAQDPTKSGADISNGAVADNGTTTVSMVGGVPVIAQNHQPHHGGGGGHAGGGGAAGGGAADGSGGAGNLAFVS